MDGWTEDEERKTRQKIKRKKCFVILPVGNSVRYARQSVGTVDDIGGVYNAR